MNEVHAATAAERSGAAVDAVLAQLTTMTHRALIVDSPPGAGKSTLVVAAARALHAMGPQVVIVAQTNNQVDDLIVRFHQADPDLQLARLSGHSYAPEAIRARVPSLCITTRTRDLDNAAIIIGTAAKWAREADFQCPWAIIDEAYQMRSDLLLALDASRFERMLLVGDPGQLDPFSDVETDRWTGLRHDPTTSSVSVLLANHPDLPVHRLPVSWRLPASAAPVVAEAFYPFLGFDAGTAPGQRVLGFETRGMRSPYDEALELASTAGWALYELPRAHTTRTDPATAAAAAGIAARLLQRGAVASCERQPNLAPLGASDIAIGVVHRDQVAEIEYLLSSSATPGAEQITVDTANRLQGREYQATVIVHPLSGRYDTSEFHLEAGRLCVLASRHRHACIVVARRGIADLLDAHASREPVHLGLDAKFPDGWQAHQAFLERLSGLTISGGI